MKEQLPHSSEPSERIPRATKAQLARRLSHYVGIKPNPLGVTQTIEHTFEQLDRDIEENYPYLHERRMGMAAIYAWATNGGTLSENVAAVDEIELASLHSGSHFYNLYTIGYGLVRDSYADAKIPMPPDVEQDLWFDRDGSPLTIEQFFDCLNVAQVDITEKYLALQLALQAFVKSKHIRVAHPSKQITALASVAASELFDSFTQMEAARQT